MRGLEEQRSASGSAADHTEEKEEGGDFGSLSNEHVITDEDFDTDLELEDKEPQYDPTGRQCYVQVCESLGVVPASYFLQHMRDSELAMEHRGLGPKGTKALAVPLVTNTSILRLNLQDNWMEGLGGADIAQMLKENCYITVYPAMASRTLLPSFFHQLWSPTASCSIWTSAATPLGTQQGNIFLRSVDLSFNGFGKEGAVALGQMLKENNVLEELNISNNRIPPEGVIRLAMGLRANKTIKSLNVGRNPIQNAGCYGLLKSIKDNKDSAMEMLDLSDIFVKQDFEDLFKSMQDTFPALVVKHGCKFGTFYKCVKSGTS
ncbi:uncharacterized protein lrrc74b isoform X2 [Eucyclogobius newberryi]|uniref:uncharacterized protein lrrc74b isoform X2 n=1 Tax=Eucyclogobius newberryi TaxID=166745 RepID=UPI003B58D7BC